MNYFQAWGQESLEKLLNNSNNLCIANKIICLIFEKKTFLGCKPNLKTNFTKI